MDPFPRNYICTLSARNESCSARHGTEYYIFPGTSGLHCLAADINLRPQETGHFYNESFAFSIITAEQ